MIDEIGKVSDPSDQELILKSFALLQLGRFQEAIILSNELIQSEQLLIRAQAYRILSATKWNNGLLIEGLRLAELSVELIQMINIENFIEKKIYAGILHNYGTVLTEQGNLTKAVDILKNSIQISLQINDDRRRAVSTVNLANIFHKQGKLVEALNLSHEGLAILERSKNKSAIAWIIGNIGLIHADRGEDNIAIDCIQKCLTLEKEVGNKMRVAESLVGLISMYLRTKNQESVIEALKEIEELIGNDSELSHYFQYSKALVLKSKKNLADKIEALHLLESYLSDPHITLEIEIQTRFNICDLLYNDLVNNTRDGIAEEINEHLKFLYETTQSNHMIPDLIKTLIFRSKMLLVQYQFKEAEKLLEQAILLSEENGIEYLKSLAIKEQNIIQESLEDWERMLERGSTMKERAEKTKLKEYLSDVLKLITEPLN